MNNRRGSRIDTDRFPKQAPKAQAQSGPWGTGGRLLQDQISTWKVFFITKSTFIIKNLTDFGRFSVEAGVDPRLNKNLTLREIYWSNFYGFLARTVRLQVPNRPNRLLMTSIRKHPPAPFPCKTYGHIEIANNTQGLVICISTEHKWN